MSKDFFIYFIKDGSGWALGADFPSIEGDDPEYEVAIRELAEYLNGLVERDTGRSNAVTLRVKED